MTFHSFCSCFEFLFYNSSPFLLFLIPCFLPFHFSVVEKRHFFSTAIQNNNQTIKKRVFLNQKLLHLNLSFFSSFLEDSTFEFFGNSFVLCPEKETLFCVSFFPNPNSFFGFVPFCFYVFLFFFNLLFFVFLDPFFKKRI